MYAAAKACAFHATRQPGFGTGWADWDKTIDSVHPSLPRDYKWSEPPFAYVAARACYAAFCCLFKTSVVWPFSFAQFLLSLCAAARETVQAQLNEAKHK